MEPLRNLAATFLELSDLAREHSNALRRPLAFKDKGSKVFDPVTALERHRAGDLQLHFATLKHIQRLAPHAPLDDLLTFVRTKAVPLVMPLTRDRNGNVVPYLEPEVDGTW